ncbi:MAG: hypothetical protein K2M64_04160, partial [Clostridia bacterium]|nr:hypothetical protein [Clostridia bacterium]
MKLTSRIVVNLDKDMNVTFDEGFDTVYQNSHLVNDFVVRPTFLLGSSQSLWVTFQIEDGSVTLKPTFLATSERKTSVANSTQQVVEDNKSYAYQTHETGYEYYMTLPNEITTNPGKWYFSLEIREVANNVDPEDYDKAIVVKTNGEEYFTVHNSLANDNGDISSPTDLDVLNLYKTTIEQANDAAQSADAAAKFAQQAQESVKDVIAGKYPPFIGDDG